MTSTSSAELRRVFASAQLDDVRRMLYGEATLMTLWSIWVLTLRPFDVSSTYAVLDSAFHGELGAGLLMLALALGAGLCTRYLHHAWLGGVLLAAGWAVICAAMASAAPTSTAALMYGAHALACAWYTHRVAQLTE